MTSILRKYCAMAAALIFLGGCINEGHVDVVSGEGTITLRLSLPYGGAGDMRSIAAEPDATGENRIDDVAILALTQKGSDWVFDYEAQIVGKVQTDGELTVTAKVREMPVTQQFVILVNAQSELTAAAPVRYEKIADIENRLVCSTGAGEWPANNNGDGNFTPFPMYARTAGQMVSASNSPIGKYNLIRMVARINVTLKAGINNFTLEEACLFNYRTAGYVSYGNSGFNGTKATAPAVPASGDHAGDPVKTPSVMYEAVSGEILSSIYTFESPAITSDAGRTKGTALVVGGYYNGAGQMSYYRIDLKDDTDPSDRISGGILRNHSYEVEIQSVTGAGYGTAEEAYIGSKPIEFTVSVTNWGAENRITLPGDGSETPSPTTTLTTDSEGRKILTDGGTYNIKVTSNTAWIASIKKGTNEVTIGDSDVLGLPLLNEATGFNGGIVTGYVGGGTAGTTTEKTITVKSVNYLEPYKFAEGDFVILFRDSKTGQIIHETMITVWQGTDPRFARSNIVWDPVNNKLTFAETKADNANIPANVQGVYFKWGSLFPVSPVGVAFDISQVLYTPVGYTGTAPSGTGLSGWATVPYRNWDSDLSGYDASTGTGDICRYISAQGWVRDKWRLPTWNEAYTLYSLKNYSYGSYLDIGTAPAGGNNAYGFYQPTGGRMLGSNATATDNVTAPSYGIYFPFSGYRGGANGQGLGTGNITYLWTTTFPNISSANTMYVGYSGTGPGQSERTYGFPIRCVRDLK